MRTSWTMNGHVGNSQFRDFFWEFCAQNQKVSSFSTRLRNIFYHFYRGNTVIKIKSKCTRTRRKSVDSKSELLIRLKFISAKLAAHAATIWKPETHSYQICINCISSVVIKMLRINELWAWFKSIFNCAPNGFDMIFLFKFAECSELWVE